MQGREFAEPRCSKRVSVFGYLGEDSSLQDSTIEE